MSVRLFARDVGTGPPLVLLHAFPLSSALWLPQREGLVSRFRVVTPDLRGFGGSPLGDDEPSVELMADDVAALLHHLKIDRAVVGGLSMGGYVAMALCRRHPDLVGGLVLAATRASADTDAVREARLRQAGVLEETGDVRVLLDEVLPGLVGPTTMLRRALVYGRVRGLVQAAPPRAAAWAQRAMAARPASFDTLAAVTTPTLVLHADEDALASEADARAMADALPDAVLQTVPNCGHLAPAEQPELFNEIVAEYAAAASRPAGATGSPGGGRPPRG